MRRLTLIIGILGLVLAASPAYSQQSRTNTGSLSVAEATIPLDVRGMGTASIDVSGTFSGTVTFEVLGVNGGTARTVDCAPPNDPGTPVNSTTDTAGLWVCPVAGLQRLQARMSAYTSGTAVVTLNAAATGGGGGGGSTTIDGSELELTVGAQPESDPHYVRCSNGTVASPCLVTLSGTNTVATVTAVTDITNPVTVNLGATDNAVLDDIADGIAVTNAGTFATQVDGAALTALQLIDNLVLAEDAVHSSTAPGIQMLVVRQDSQSDLCADGDYCPMTVNANGELRVTGGSGLGPTTQDDDDGDIAAAQNADLVINLMYAWDGDSWARVAQATTTEATHGTTLGTITSVVGGVLMGNASTATPTDVGADGDAAAIWLTRNGAVNVAHESLTELAAAINASSEVEVSIVNTGVTVPVSHTGLDALELAIRVEDAAETAGTSLAMAGSVRRDTAASSAGTTGENATVNTDASGLLWTRQMDPCTANARTTVPISVAADTAVIAAGGGSTRTYICGGALVASAAEVLSIWEGTGTACGTSSAALAGSTTEANGMSLAANGGFIVPNTIRGISTNVDVCIRLNATNRVAGWLSYVQVAQ